MDNVKKLPLVSVILATFKGEKYLQTQLDAVFNQTYPSLEVIAIDDVSTDNTLNILNEYARKHSNMKVIVNEKNLGPIKNFQKGCELSSGDLIALCDQDDYWVTEKISRLVDEIGNYQMIYSDSFICNENLEKTGRKISDNVACQTLYSCLQQAVFGRIYGHATLFKRELYHTSTPFLDVISHDWWLCYNATLNGGIKYLNEPLNFYRQHSHNYYGAVGTKRKKKIAEDKKAKKLLERKITIKRINAFYEACPLTLQKEKNVLQKLVKSYNSFSITNNFLRMFIFFKYHKLLLAMKKRSLIRQYLFCLKTFVSIV